MSLVDIKEFIAETREEALAKAAAVLGVAEDELEVVGYPDTADISGMNGRAMVLVRRPGGVPDAAPQRGRGRDGRDRDGDRGRGRGRDRDRGGRDGDRRESRGRDRDRDRGRGRNDAGNDAGRGRGRGGRGRGERPEGVDDERLERVAAEAADRVAETGEAVVMEAMSSKERWVVHNFLKERDDVRSSSEGDDDDRRVRVERA